jgi:hypothetical protein
MAAGRQRTGLAEAVRHTAVHLAGLEEDTAAAADRAEAGLQDRTEELPKEKFESVF